MTEKEAAARRLFQDTFEQVKALGVRVELDFGIAVKHISDPSVSDFQFTEVEEEEESHG